MHIMTIMFFSPWNQSSSMFWILLLLLKKLVLNGMSRCEWDIYCPENRVFLSFSVSFWRDRPARSSVETLLMLYWKYVWIPRKYSNGRGINKPDEGTRISYSLSVQFLLFSCNFRGEIWPINRLVSDLLGWRSLSDKSRIRHCDQLLLLFKFNETEKKGKLESYSKVLVSEVGDRDRWLIK